MVFADELQAQALDLSIDSAVLIVVSFHRFNHAAVRCGKIVAALTGLLAMTQTKPSTDTIGSAVATAS